MRQHKGDLYPLPPRPPTRALISPRLMWVYMILAILLGDALSYLLEWLKAR